MELQLQNGDYVMEAGKLQCVSGVEELAQRVLMRLRARRGAFYLMPEYGSRLYQLSKIKPSKRETAARQYVAEALEEEKEVQVTEVYLTEPERDGQGILTVELEYRGEHLQLAVEV